ncbi:MAG: FRG domain-containing protein [Mariniphaga sp.]
MEVFSVSRYEDIEKITHQIKFELGDDAVLYRGTDGPLIPSIARYTQSSSVDLAVKECLLLEEFYKFYHHKYSFDEGAAKDWEVRIAAREFDLASSLMDWTCSLDIAIEFAINRFVQKNLSYTNLWVLKKPGLKQITINLKTTESFNEISEATIVQLTQFSETTHWHRKSVQGGYFLKQPVQNIAIPLDKNPDFESQLIQVVIPQNAVGNIWKIIANRRDLDLPSMPNKFPSDETLGKICDALNNKYL